jgi:hypothetical protein
MIVNGSEFESRRRCIAIKVDCQTLFFFLSLSLYFINNVLVMQAFIH